jgi:hypothetical protein
MDTDRERLFDARVVERNITAGLVTREEYEKYLAGLEDCASRADSAHARMVLRPRSRDRRSQGGGGALTGEG